MNTNIIRRVAVSANPKVILFVTNRSYVEVAKNKNEKCMVIVHSPVDSNVCTEGFLVDSYKDAHKLILFYGLNGLQKTMKAFKSEYAAYPLN